MLHVIQMTSSESVALPRIYSEMTNAKKAFIALVKECRGVEYTDFCTDNEADPDSFATARAFASSEMTNGINFYYWQLNPEDAVAAASIHPQAQEKGEKALSTAVEVQKQILAVQPELRDLAEKIANMSQELIHLQKSPHEELHEVKIEDVFITSDQFESPPPPLDDKYQTAEWQEFVQSLIQMCGGSFGEFPLLSRQDWRQAVYHNNIKFEYWQWASITIDQAIEMAKNEGYLIEEDVPSGHFSYISPSGEHSPTLYELEDLAWCAAGLHAKQGIKSAKEKVV